LLLALTRDVVADEATPIEITLLGPSAIRIRVAEGSTFPCDSSDNHIIVDGKFAPGQVVHTATPDRCACFQQTYEPFPDTDWSASTTVCRPQICTNIGKLKCVPAPDPTIRLRISSKRPA
jgi:hypothetical protein